MSRRCFYIPIEQFDDNGYIPSIVVENEAGHSPMMGNGPLAQPWYWGKTYEEAKELAEKENLRCFGLRPEESAEIVASSMAAGPVGETAQEEVAP